MGEHTENQTKTPASPRAAANVSTAFERCERSMQLHSTGEHTENQTKTPASPRAAAKVSTAFERCERSMKLHSTGRAHRKSNEHTVI